jgi:uncharacterized protein (DUF2147 family)
MADATQETTQCAYYFRPSRSSRSTAADRPAASIEGHWRSPGGNSIILIGPAARTLCGKIEWASEKAKQIRARPSVDQLVGAQLLTNLTQDKNGNWQGKLFIPDKNMRVTAKIQLVSPNSSGSPAARSARQCARRRSGPVPTGRCRARI